MKREFFRFAVAGGSCFIIELAVLYSLTEFAGINYLTSAFWAFVVSVIVNYIMCAYWVFAAKKRSLAKTIVFAATSVAGLGINQVRGICRAALYAGEGCRCLHSDNLELHHQANGADPLVIYQEPPGLT